MLGRTAAHYGGSLKLGSLKQQEAATALTWGIALHTNKL